MLGFLAGRGPPWATTSSTLVHFWRWDSKLTCLSHSPPPSLPSPLWALYTFEPPPSPLDRLTAVSATLSANCGLGIRSCPSPCPCSSCVPISSCMTWSALFGTPAPAASVARLSWSHWGLAFSRWPCGLRFGFFSARWLSFLSGWGLFRWVVAVCLLYGVML